MICGHKWKVLYMIVCVDWKGSGNQQPEGKCIAWCHVCTRATIIKDKETNRDATCTCRYTQAMICGTEPLHKAVLIRVQTLVLQHNCPQAAAFLIPFSQHKSQIVSIFVGENILWLDLSMYLRQPIWTIFTHSKHTILKMIRCRFCECLWGIYSAATQNRHARLIPDSKFNTVIHIEV